MLQMNISITSSHFSNAQAKIGGNPPPKNVKVVKEPSDEYQTDCHEIEPNLSKDRAMPAGDYPSL